jgi:hypothetical protein
MFPKSIRLVDRHAEGAEYVLTCWGDIYKISGTTPDGRAVYNEYFDDYNGFYHADVLESHEYMVLEIIKE